MIIERPEDSVDKIHKSGDAIRDRHIENLEKSIAEQVQQGAEKQR
jgi:hypothetical protein